MLIKKNILKKINDIKKLFLLASAFVLVLFSSNVSATVVDEALGINTFNETSKPVAFQSGDQNVLSLTAPVMVLNSSTPVNSKSEVAIPLPATLPLMISGIIALGLMSWTRSKK